MKDPDFDQASYWQRRIGGDIDIGVVGHRSLGRAYNEYIYRRRVDVLAAAVKELELDLTKSTVLDVGAGSGYYVEFWQRLGVPTLLGIDLSRDGIARLRKIYTNYNFLCADITNPSMSANIDARFYVITIFDVLYHITDDDDAQQALNSLSSLLKPDGHILAFDHILKRDYVLRQHVKYRSERHYAKMLERAGLEIVERKQLFVFLEPPVVGCKSVDVLISGVYMVVGVFMKRWSSLGNFIGKLVYQLDSRLSRIGIRTSNHELLIIKKRGEPLR